MKEFADDPENEFCVYCYLTSLEAKFILMIEKKEQKKEERIKGFLQSVHKLYTAVGLAQQFLMNPLYPLNTKIKSEDFSKAVFEVVNEYLLK